jgi:hypothetical protein
MNAYFFKMTKEEKENILDKHKHVYDGYVTEYVKPNQTPLYVQDLANDKEGVTVNNKGEVTTYKNMNINESDAFTGAVYLPEPTFEEEDEYVSVGAPLDMIGDGDDDLEHGTFEDEEEFEECAHCDETDEYDEEVIDDIFSDGEFDEETIEEIKSKLKESIDMFNRFKKFN